MRIIEPKDFSNERSQENLPLSSYRESDGNCDSMLSLYASKKTERFPHQPSIQSNIHVTKIDDTIDIPTVEDDLHQESQGAPSGQGS